MPSDTPTTPAEWEAHYRAQGEPEDLILLLVASLDPTWEGDAPPPSSEPPPDASIAG